MQYILNLLAKLPFSLLYRISDIIYFIVYYLIGYRKQVVLDNLRASFPDLSEKRLYQLAKGFYRNMTDVLVEVIKVQSLSKKQLLSRVSFRNNELLQPYLEQDQAIILAATHSCNWEWLFLASCAKLPIPIHAIYKSLHKNTIDTFMHNLRSRFGASLIRSHESIFEIMRQKKQIKALAIVADQTPMRAEDKYWTRCLNQDTAFAVGIDKIAKMTKYPVIFVGMKRLKRGYYEVEFKPLATPPYDKNTNNILDSYAKLFEQQVIENPADWLWSNKKWKYKKPHYAANLS